MKPGSRWLLSQDTAALLAPDPGQRRGREGAEPPPGGSPPSRGLRPALQAPRQFLRPREPGVRHGGRRVVPSPPHGKVSRPLCQLEGVEVAISQPRPKAECAFGREGRRWVGTERSERGLGGNERFGFPRSENFKNHIQMCSLTKANKASGLPKWEALVKLTQILLTLSATVLLS